MFSNFFSKSKANLKNKHSGVSFDEKAINFLDSQNNTFSIEKEVDNKQLHIYNPTLNLEMVLDQEKALLLSLFLNEYGLTGTIEKTLTLLEKKDK